MKFSFYLLFSLIALAISATTFAACSQDAISAIDGKYRQHQSWMGPATVGHFTLPGGVGCGRHYQLGSVYFHPCIGAVEIHGLIRNLWAEQGWEKGGLGFPLTDELTMTDTVGRVTFFQGGAVYYHPTHGTRKMTQKMHRLWRDRGGIGGLGYPIADMTCHPGRDTCSQNFQRGSLQMKIGVNEGMVDLRGEIARLNLAIRDQEPRPTCSVHTITFLLEYAYSQVCGFNKFTDLSEEYLNHAANLASGSQDDGDFFSNVISGYNKYGMVSESKVPFKKSYTFSGYVLPVGSETEGQKLLKNKTLSITFIKPISTPMGLSEIEFQKILSALSRGVPVGVGRGHSMPIVGYRMDASMPGGGVFIFRNSYGTDEGVNGYQEEDFASVKSSASDVVIVEPAMY